MKRTAFSNARGFSTLQLVITMAVMAVVTGFAVVSISRARDHVKLMNSARQFAAYVERARADAVRRHGTATASISDDDTYLIRMDWDGFGNATDRNFDLERGVTFTDGMVGKSITFDWRGRIAGEESFGFAVNRNTLWQKTVNVGVTGSGDVTFEAEYFYDGNLPPVTVAPTPAGGGVLPEPGATPGPGYGSPSPSPGASPTPTAGASPTPTATPNQNPTPTPTPNQNPTPTPTPDQNPTPAPSPTPTQPCAINGPNSITIGRNSSSSVSVYRSNVTGAGTISATSSNSGQIQVNPSSRSVTGTAPGSFTITVKRSSGSVTFSSSGCTSKTVTITVP